jgi:hypothetical protein
MKKKKPGLFFLVLFAGFFSCGIEDDYPYLFPVETISTEGTTTVRIPVPDNYGNPANRLYEIFRYYAIFYRIYASDSNLSSVTTSDLASIHPVLSSDYYVFEPYTSNDTASPSAMASIFSARRYYQLYVQTGVPEPQSAALILKHPDTVPPFSPPGVPIYNAGSTVIYPLAPSGCEIIITFAESAYGGPYLRLTYPYAVPSGGTQSADLPLRRSVDGGVTAVPDRTFYRSAALLTDAGSNVNTDVEKKAGTIVSQNAFVSMYIVAVGVDSRNLTAVFSKPKHLGVFRLPQHPGEP